MVLNIKEFFIFFRYEAIFTWLKTPGMAVHAIRLRIHKGFR